MRRIVQLESYEYEKLVEISKLNQDQIEEKALKMWNEKGVAEVNVNIRMGEDYKRTFSIDCRPYMLYTSDKFFIPEKIRERFRHIIKGEIDYLIKSKFGTTVDAINFCNRRIDEVNRIRGVLWAVAASGWAVAAVALLF